MRRAKFAMAGLGAACLVLVAAVPVLADGNLRPRPIQVQTNNGVVRATLGSYCVERDEPDGSGTGICADSRYPLKVHGRVDVEPGQRFALRTHDRSIRAIRMGLIKVHKGNVIGTGPSFGANPRSGHPARWVASLPNDLKGSNRIDIQLIYKHHIGDADYWAGLRAR